MATLRVPDVVPSPIEDCQRLRKAFEGLTESHYPFCPCISSWFGTDEKAVIDVLGRRNASQRKIIRETYYHLYNKSLVDDLHSEFSGDFKKAIILWTYDPCERDARLANEAICTWKKGIRELQVVVEIACASSPNHLISVRKAYCSLFGRSIEEDIISNVPLLVQKILVSLVSSYRYDKELVDSAIANSEAAALHDAIELRNLEAEELVFICSTRNFFQLRQTFQHYKHKYGKSIEEDILSFGKGLLESVLKVAISCIESPEKHFAEVINASIVGFGTDEDSLTRAIVTRSETDLMKVKEEYFNANKSSLESAVIGDTSGDYKNFLMTLLGAQI